MNNLPPTVFGVGVNLAILHFDGKSWTAMPANAPIAPGKPNLLIRAWGTGPGDVYAAGFDGVLLHYDGRSWAPLPSGTTESLGVFGVERDVFISGRRRNDPAPRGEVAYAPEESRANTPDSHRRSHARGRRLRGCGATGGGRTAPPARVQPVTVPTGDGTPVITDGVFTPGERDDALEIPVSDGVTMFLKEYRGRGLRRCAWRDRAV